MRRPARRLRFTSAAAAAAVACVALAGCSAEEPAETSAVPAAEAAVLASLSDAYSGYRMRGRRLDESTVCVDWIPPAEHADEGVTHSLVSVPEMEVGEQTEGPCALRERTLARQAAARKRLRPTLIALIPQIDAALGRAAGGDVGAMRELKALADRTMRLSNSYYPDISNGANLLMSATFNGLVAARERDYELVRAQRSEVARARAVLAQEMRQKPEG